MMDRRDKKNKDKFHIKLVGAIIYSVVLLFVMAGTYVTVKHILNSYKPEAITVAEDEVLEESVEEPVEDEPQDEEEVTEEVAEDEPTEPNVHEADIKDIINGEAGVVDYSKVIFEPAKRNASLKWSDTVFSKLEDSSEPSLALINNYPIKRVNATLSDQKSAEYRVFTNPESGFIEKITEVVNCGDRYQVIDYYYDLGNINYIAQYNMVIEKPIPLTSAEIESRYYFKNDVMVRYIYCSNGKAIEYSVADLKSYSEGTVDQYDYLEKDMINRAYIVYNLGTSLEETNIFYGYVLDEFSVPIEDAKVIITNETTGERVASTETDGDGYYKLSVKCDPDNLYCVTADADEFNYNSVFDIPSKEGSGKYAVDPLYLNYKKNGGFYNVSLLVRDATDSSKGLSQGLLKLRKGLNNREGDVILAGQLDDIGGAIVPLAAGCYTAEAAKGGYETTYFPVVVRIDHQAAVGYAVPDVESGDFVAVLSWETSPLDLDFKAISSVQGQIIHSAADSVGATTAEYVTIKNAGSDSYRFYVSDHGSIMVKDAMSYSMTTSNALVTVYSADGIEGCFHVPVASAGTIWEPFDIYNGKVLPVNYYYYGLEPNELWLGK